MLTAPSSIVPSLTTGAVCTVDAAFEETDRLASAALTTVTASVFFMMRQSNPYMGILRVERMMDHIAIGPIRHAKEPNGRSMLFPGRLNRQTTKRDAYVTFLQAVEIVPPPAACF